MKFKTEHRLQVRILLLRSMVARGVFIIVLIMSAHSVSAQVPEFDKLEMLFAQRHYKRVYRQSRRLLDKPEYDYSLMPTYYQSLSLFQLAQNPYWLSRHPEAIDEAEKMLLEVKTSEDGTKIFNAHMYEISWLKSDMTGWASDLKRMGNQDHFERVQLAMKRIFGGVPDLPVPGEVSSESNNTTDGGEEAEALKGKRNEIVAFAKQQLGVPYVWAGNTPSGFDCSGFTGYVMKQYGYDLPRRSADQYDGAKKVKQKNVRKGDLVFFNNGSGISHVGIVISEKGQPLTMIHSSSSKGIIITEVEQSEYWMKRLHGFATYINQ